MRMCCLSRRQIHITSPVTIGYLHIVYMNVCVCVCVWTVCVCVWIVCVCVCVCVCARASLACVCLHVYIHITHPVKTGTYMNVFVFVFVCVCLCACVCMCLYVYRYRARPVVFFSTFVGQCRRTLAAKRQQKFSKVIALVCVLYKVTRESTFEYSGPFHAIRPV